MIDDSLTTGYTGVDSEPGGIFENETVDKKTKRIIDEQKRMLAEITPKLQDILDMLDKEIQGVDSIKLFVNAAERPAADIRAELQAGARYIAYVESLKTKFTLMLNETRK